MGSCFNLVEHGNVSARDFHREGMLAPSAATRPLLLHIGPSSGTIEGQPAVYVAYFKFHPVEHDAGEIFEAKS